MINAPYLWTTSGIWHHGYWHILEHRCFYSYHLFSKGYQHGNYAIDILRFAKMSPWNDYYLALQHISSNVRKRSSGKTRYWSGGKSVPVSYLCPLYSLCAGIYFSCDQAALRTLLSVSFSLSVHPSVCLFVCLSVCPSVCYNFFLSSYHHEIFRSYNQWQMRCPCKWPRSEVKGQGYRGQNPIKPFPDCNSSLNWHMVMKWCTELAVA